MNNKTLAIVLAIIAVGVLGFAGYKMFGPGPEVTADIKCEKCQATDTAKVNAKTSYPIACPKCKDVAAYTALKYKCSDANCPKSKVELYLEKEIKKDEKTKGNLCPKCNKPTLELQ